MDDRFVPDDIRDIIERLTHLAAEQNLVTAAEEGCAAWFHNHGADIPYKLSDVKMEFRSQSLAFRNAMLSYPYIVTHLEMSVDGWSIGHYRLITLLDGTVDDDYFELNRR